MSSDSFVHLHTHSEYSLLDGASRVEELCAKAAEFGMPAVALTDHGAMFGTLDFYEAARRHGIKPIIGVEAYVAPGKRFDRTPGESEEKYRHLTLLARSEEGYRNLLRLVTDAHLEGFWHRPRIDKELLAERSKGLIGLSGCLASETARLLLAGQELKARDVVATYRDILGPEGFYLEVQDHGLPEQARVNPMLVDLSKATGIPLAATNDIHYTEREHARPHDVLLCIQQQKVLTDTNRLKFDTDEFFLKPSAQMRKVFAALPEACDATLGIAEACELDLRFGELHLPRFDPPAGKTLDGYLRELVEEGARKRYGTITEEVRQRFDSEQKQMPDIDMDFDERRRDEVIRYVAEKYGGHASEQIVGNAHVAQIITFQTIKGKQGIRDAARVLGFPPMFGDRLCKMYPPALLGRDYSIDKALELSSELGEAYQKEPEAKEVIDAARALEGLRREDSVHAAGVVIGDAPLVNYLPLKLGKDSSDYARRIVTQFDMHGVEKLALLKMDFLGLRNLSVIENTVALLRDKGIHLDIDHVPLDDQASYAMLQRGDTNGVFQLESPGMRQLIQVLVPDRFEDLMALVALYRPGLLSMGQHIEYAERKHGRKPLVYPHGDLEPILVGTYGIIVYQEQVMQIAAALAGYSMGEADLLRNAMGKKIREQLIPHRHRFVRGAVARGYSDRLANDIFDLITPFADYGFNASHACAYAYVAYQTAYLKAHHPVEYVSALLTSVRDDKDKKPFYLNAARLMGLRVLPPDVNESQTYFTPTDGDIRYGLAAVRNVGEGVVQQIIESRQKSVKDPNGPPS